MKELKGGTKKMFATNFFNILDLGTNGSIRFVPMAFHFNSIQTTVTEYWKALK